MPPFASVWGEEMSDLRSREQLDKPSDYGEQGWRGAETMSVSHEPSEVAAQETPLPTISVVVPMRNEERHIGECLESILRQDYPPAKVEILVVDGMSEDRSREIVCDFASKNPNVQLLDNLKQIQSSAVNIGIRQAKGDLICPISAHSHVEADYLSQCVKYLRLTKADNVGGILLAVGENYVGEAIALAMSCPFGIGNSKFRYSNQEQYVDTVGFGTFPRTIFDRIGLFDERLVANEDYEFNYRLRSSGGRIFYTPAIKVLYHCRDSLLGLWKQYFQYGFWKAQVIKKHPRSIAFRHLVPPIFVGTLVTTGLLGLASHRFRYLFALVVLSYLMASLVFSTAIARREGWRYLPILPLTFACVHLAWGSGALWGLLRVIPTWKRDGSKGNDNSISVERHQGVEK